MKKRPLTLRAVLFCAVLALLARADSLDAKTITIRVLGEVAGITGRHPESLLDDHGITVNVGDPMTAIFTYDPNLPDADPLPAVGLFEHRTAGLGFSLVTAGELVMRSDPHDPDFDLQITNNRNNSDTYGALSYYNTSNIPGGLTSSSVTVFLSDSSRTVFDDVAPPLNSPDRAEFDAAIFELRGILIGARGAFSDFTIYGSILSVELLTGAAVPEPSTGFLLLLAGVCLKRKRRPGNSPNQRSPGEATENHQRAQR